MDVYQEPTNDDNHFNKEGKKPFKVNDLLEVRNTFFNPIRTTCLLVKMSIQAYIEPIRECVIKNSLICKFVMLCYQSFIMIGLTNENVMILTNQKVC